MIVKLLNEELEYEKNLLDSLSNKRNSYPTLTLLYSAGRKNSFYFYTREKNSKQRKYIHRNDTTLLRKVAYGRYLDEQIRALKCNIQRMENTVRFFHRYDADSIISGLPSAYRKAIEFLRSGAPPVSTRKVVQSENPTNREGLIYLVSNGLYVRSKNELAIAEMLLQFQDKYGYKFYYEKALLLKERVMDENGEITINAKIIHPDFTIETKDGRVFYWEHAGKLDEEEYSGNFFKRILLYFENGIYQPHNLIITTDGPDNPFDNLAVKRIIDSFFSSESARDGTDPEALSSPTSDISLQDGGNSIRP